MKFTENKFFAKAASGILVATLMVTMTGFGNKKAEAGEIVTTIVTETTANSVADEIMTNIQETTGVDATTVSAETTTQQSEVTEKDVLLTVLACANSDIYLSYAPCKEAFDKALEIAASTEATTSDINRAIKNLTIMMAEAIKETQTTTSEPATEEATTDIPVTEETTTKITVGKATVSGVTNVKGRKAKITIKKMSGVNNYQIKYSTSKKFKGSITVVSKKLTYTIKGLKKGNTYYVKARAYKTVEGIRHYGTWSKVKKVTIKK